MNPVVIDTNVVSFLFKDDTRAAMYLPHLQDRQWLISFMTQAELEQWALTANWRQKRIDWLRIFLGRFVVVPSPHALVLNWAIAMNSARKCGRRIETADAWIAATALLYDAPLLTQTKSDYPKVTGLKFGNGSE